MKPLHILQVYNRIPWPLNDGGNIAVYNLTRHLFRAGHKVTLACLNTSKHRQDPMVLKEAHAVHTVDIDTDVTVGGALMGMFSSLPYNVARFLSQDFSEMLQQLLKDEQFDLIQLEGSYMSLYISAIQAVTDTPIVLRSHNVEFQIWERLARNEGNLLKSLYMRHLARKIQRFELLHLQDYDAIIPIAHHDELFYRAEGYRKPIRTISGGVDLGAFEPKTALTPNRKIGFLGSLEWMPNVQGLMWFLEDIWPSILQKHPDTELHVAGKNPLPFLKELEVKGMTFHGMVPDAAEFMESCHFFIVPLKSGGGMRLKIVEALAMGRCVISTEIGAEGIEAENLKEIVLADTEAEWIAAIESLLAQPGHSLDIASAGRRLAIQNFGLAAVGADLEDFYKEVLA